MHASLVCDCLLHKYADVLARMGRQTRPVPIVSSPQDSEVGLLSVLCGASPKSVRGESPRAPPNVQTMMAKAPKVQPRNANQARLIEKLKAMDPPIVIASGSAGAGKTMIASMVGLRKLYDGHVKRIIITRPVASMVGEELGHLPGTMASKMAPWTVSILESFYSVLSPYQVQHLMDENIIEICPVAYCRGRTFSDAWVIVDESQNLHVPSFKALLSRIGPNSKMVITGDQSQSDIKGVNGLVDFLSRIGEGIPGEIEVINFTNADVVRHPVIQTVLDLYDKKACNQSDRHMH